MFNQNLRNVFFFLLLMDMTAGVPAVIPKVSKFNEIRI